MTRKAKSLPPVPLAPLRKVLTGIAGFDEITNQIVANAATLGWNIPVLAAKKLFFVDANLSSRVDAAAEIDLTKELNLLRAYVREAGAKYIVFDGIDVLLRSLDDPQAELREIYRLREWILESGLTAIITQKSGVSDDDTKQGYSILPFIADCVIALSHHVLAGSSFRNLRVTKYRGSGYLADEFPITITDTGMQVRDRGPVELLYAVTDERISTGLPRLDAMLTGGYHRASNVLISGAPGTAKSTLAGLFVEAACQRGERAMYVSFDEGATQIVRNLASVGIQLKAHEKSGLLKIYSTRTRGPNIEQQFGELRRVILEHRPTCVVIDPLSALASKLAHVASADATQMFLDFLKVNGITVVNTSLLDGPDVGEATATGISTIADTWIHVSYVVNEGERNRALTIVKSRGTGHSNQVRELILSDTGVTLTDVYTAQGEVLMGVARWDRERSELAVQQKALRTAAIARVRLKSAQAEAAARLAVITTEIEVRAAELALLDAELTQATELRSSEDETLRKLRHADAEVATAGLAVVPMRQRKTNGNAKLRTTSP